MAFIRWEESQRAGVVEDFNAASLHQEVQPVLITQHPPFSDKAEIKIAAGADLPSAIGKIEEAFKKAFPESIFEFKFLDDQIEALYKSEGRLYTLFKVFSGLAMLISCFGLWGLVNFSAQRRTKEIGIRKVLGASVAGIVSLLTREFILMVAIAFAIATPLAWWGIQKWLQDFAYRVEIDWKPFVLAAVTAVLIAFITVGFQAVKAAFANPVRSLRSE